MVLFLVGNSAVLCPLYIYRERHPVNLLLLGLFTLSISFAVGMSCAFTSGNIRTLSLPLLVQEIAKPSLNYQKALFEIIFT